MHRVLRTAIRYGLLVLSLGVLFALLVYPILLTVRGGFYVDATSRTGFTLEHIKLVFQDPRLVGSLLNSVLVATSTTSLAIFIALPLAILAARYDFPGKGFFNAAVLIPLILPPFVGAIGLRAILGRAGALNALLGTEWDVLGNAAGVGVVCIQALSLYPIIYLNATASLANLDPALDECARNLGAGFWTRLLRITMPLIRPGVFAGATIVFVWSFTELGTPLMFEFHEVAPVQIFNGLKEVEGSARPYALTVVVLLLALCMYMLGKFVFGREGYAMQTRASRAADVPRLSGVRGAVAALLFALVAFLAMLPHAGVVLTSLTPPGQWYHSILPRAFTMGHYEQALTSADAFQAILNSLRLAGAAMVVDVLFGLLVAYLLVRTKLPLRWLLDSLCMLPLAVPGLVLAFGYVAMSLRWPFGREGPLGGIASVLAADPNPVPFLIAAYAIRRLPYIVRSSIAGLEQTSGDLEEAAINLGASRLTAVRRIIVPLILANLIAGGLLVFAFSMLEVSDSIILAQQAGDYPVTKAILAFMDRLGDGPYIASAMGVWGMALLTTTIFAASMLLGKRLGAIFRA
jgi:iron(III) transport system permease protein